LQKVIFLGSVHFPGRTLGSSVEDRSKLHVPLPDGDRVLE
jgi:hypothetical protein